MQGLKVKDLSRLSNKVVADDFEQSDLINLRDLVAVTSDRLALASVKKAALASAEINGLSKVPDSLKDDTLHYLISTDTLIGVEAMQLIERWLIDRDQSVQAKTIEELTTRDSDSFMKGAKNLLHFLTGVISKYGTSYHIVFNLTGGFKSLLGLMTSLGYFYADEVVYVFESGEDLIRIPKLPIKLDDDLLKGYAPQLLRMSVDTFITLKEAHGIPQALIENVDEEYVGLSVWGELIWEQISKDILTASLVELPYLQYESTFKADFKMLEKPAKVQLQKQLARASAFLAEKNGSREALLGNNAGGIKYEQFTGKNSRYGHFRFGRGHRVSCESVPNKLLLRHCGEHNYVNDNP